MSVPEPLRHKGRMEVHIKTQYLATYTIHILSNDKTFPNSVDSELIRRIKNCAIDIHIKAWNANKIRAETNFVNREMRYTLQEEAILQCDEMLALIGIAKHVFHLRSKRIQHWGGLITEAQDLLKSWKESDVRRYGQP